MRPNTLHPQFLQVHALTLFPGQVSSSRADMFSSEIGQAPPLKGADIRRFQTGMERRFGKYTDMVRIPCNASIIKVIAKRTSSAMLVNNSIPFEKTVIYQDVDTGAYGCVTVPIYSLNHTTLGFDFVRTPIVDSLTPGFNIPKDTILAHSPSLDREGNYKFGINAKIAFMSINEVSQDGMVISESFAQRATFKGYGVRTLTFGGNTIPLNLYGDDQNYKLFPDVGEVIEPTGLLFATREIEEGITAIQMTSTALKMAEETDRKVYAEPGARILKIEVFHTNSSRSRMDSAFTQQCENYLVGSQAYYSGLLQVYQQIKKEAGGRTPLLEPEFHRLLVEAEAHTYTRGNDRNNIVFTEKGNPLGEWTVKIHFSHDLVPDVVFKAADLSGGFE